VGLPHTTSGHRARTAAVSILQRASIVAARHSGSASKPNNSAGAVNSLQSARVVQADAKSSALWLAAVKERRMMTSVADSPRICNPKPVRRFLLP
jgi:hypothetical protein